MGYCTRFELEVTPDDENVWEAIEENEELSYPLIDGSECKWYDHEEDMKRFSINHSDHLFKLSGVGEENGDLWIKYFKNGKMQNCPAIITYDEFDESKLK